MLVSNRPTNEELSKTFAVFIPENRRDTITLPQTKESMKDKFERKYGMLYTAGTIAAGAGILFALHRGGKLGNFTQYVKKHVTSLHAKALEKMENSSSLDWFQRIKLGLMVNTSKFLRKLQGFGNINPIKDIVVDRGLIKMEDKLHIKGKTFFDRITNFFIKYGKKLAGSKYKKPAADLSAFRTTLDKAIHEIEKLSPEAISGHTPSQLAVKLRELSSLSDRELKTVIDGFGNRFDGMVKVLQENSENRFLSSLKSARGSTVGEKFFNKIRELGDFIPTREMKGYHKAIFAPLNRSKMAISNSILDLHKNLSTALDNIFYNDCLHRPELRKNYLALQKHLKAFLNPKTSNIARNNTRGQLLEELRKTAENFQKLMPDSDNSLKIQELISLVQADKRGAVEEAVHLCKILKSKNPSLYNELVAARNKFQKSFNNAIDFETDKSYRKMLDFSLHSLTTDLFTQAVGVGTIGYILANRKKSAKEKLPAILKDGIPVAGGLAVAFLCNLRQVASGPGSLFLAIVSGFALNRIGSIISNKYVQDNNQVLIAKN
ncbi:MAG: hypothetical protein K6A44_07065 [bacterium]|nr:hypothetical protein [bacterium]